MTDDYTEPPAPQIGDTVEVTLRGVFRLATPDDAQMAYNIELPNGVWLWLPEDTLFTIVEPTTPGTVVTGWPDSTDTRPEMLQVWVRCTTDADGTVWWNTPGSPTEALWDGVLTVTAHGRRIITPQEPTQEGA